MKSWVEYFNERCGRIHPPCQYRTAGQRRDDLVAALVKAVIEAKRHVVFDRMAGASLKETMNVVRHSEIPFSNVVDAEAIHHIECKFDRIVERWREQWPHMTNPL